MNNAHLSLANVLIQHGLQCLNIDALNTRFSVENPALALRSDALAYISYTSGSTGQPKGVIETHHNFLHAMRIQTNDFHICVHDRLLMLGALSGAIFAACSMGHRSIRWISKKKGQDIATYLLQEEITIYHSVPSVFRHFVQTLTGEKQFPKLRLITLLGESVSKRDVELYQKHFAPPCILVNSLGTTETENFCRYFLDHNTQITGSLVPAGYAIEDKTVLMLSDEGKEVDYNEIGEITVQSRFLPSDTGESLIFSQAAFQPAIGGEKNGSIALATWGSCSRMAVSSIWDAKTFRSKCVARG